MYVFNAIDAIYELRTVSVIPADIVTGSPFVETHYSPTFSYPSDTLYNEENKKC